MSLFRKKQNQTPVAGCETAPLKQIREILSQNRLTGVVFLEDVNNKGERTEGLFCIAGKEVEIVTSVCIAMKTDAHIAELIRQSVEIFNKYEEDVRQESENSGRSGQE